MRKVINQKRLRRWEAAGGVCCFLAGILAALLGSLFSAYAWIVGAEIHPWIHTAGTALLIVTIPLILFAGFCLDWSERRPNKACDNDRDPGPGKVPPEPIMISKEIERGVKEAGVTRTRKSDLLRVKTVMDNDKLKRIGHKENNVGPNFYRGNCAVLSYRHRLCARVRKVAIGVCHES